MATIPVVVKHAGARHELDLDLSQPAEVFKYQLYSVTGVEPDRQKIVIKGGQLRDDTDLLSLNLKPGHSFMMMGTPAGKGVQAPKEKMKFIEDMSEADRAKAAGATPAGLENLGNTCYMNSTLQTLRYVPELQQELQKYKETPGSGVLSDGFGVEGASSLLTGIGGAMGGDLTAALRDLYRQMAETTGGFPPVIFLGALRNVFPQFAQRGRDGQFAQQDAEECYSQIISQLRQKLKISSGGESSASGVSFIDKYLAGEMTSTIKCDEDAPGEPPLETTESFVSLKCHISVSTSHLRDGLLAGLVEKIKKNSPTLGRDAVYTKTSRVARLPKYLTCHFVRFFWKKDIKKKVKIMRKVTFPFELDASELCTDELRLKLIPVRDRLRDLRKDSQDRERTRKRLKRSAANPDDIAGGNAGVGGFGAAQNKKAAEAEEKEKSEAEAKLKEAEENLPDWEQELKEKLDPELAKDEGCNPSGLYELMGVVTHQGASADSGHYCSYVKKEGGGGDNWWFFNDDKVSEVPKDRIESLAGGGESHSALILLYRAAPLTPLASDIKK